MTRLSIQDLAVRLHAHANPWKAFAVIWGYFDDAGTHFDSEVTSVGGLVGTTEVWSAFESDWLAVINDFREYGLTAFHAYDCEVGDGDFRGFPREIREAISRRFSRIVAKHRDLRIFWFSCVNRAWEEAADEAFKARYENPLGLCFEMIVQQVSRWSTNYAKGSPVSMVFSEQLDFHDRMQEVFTYYLRGKRYSPLRSITFASYRDVLALQGADQIATEINRHWRAAELNSEKMRARPEIIEFAYGRGLHLGSGYDKPAIIDAVRDLRARTAAYEADMATGKAPPTDAYTEGWNVRRLKVSDGFVLMPPNSGPVYRLGEEDLEPLQTAHCVRLRCL